MYGFDHFGMGLGGLGMVLLWAVPLILIFLLFRYFSGDRGERRGKAALEILEARYARGEIDREEYLKRRADLGGEAGRRLALKGLPCVAFAFPRDAREPGPHPAANPATTRRCRQAHDRCGHRLLILPANRPIQPPR